MHSRANIPAPITNVFARESAVTVFRTLPKPFGSKERERERERETARETERERERETASGKHGVPKNLY